MGACNHSPPGPLFRTKVGIGVNSLKYLIEAFLVESKMFRGDTAVPLKQLNDLILGKGSQRGILGRPAKREGEAFDCQYEFDPSIWGKWYSSQSAALSFAATDSVRGMPGQHVGAPQGGTVMKRNYGGRVVYAPGKARSDFEALPSAMDKYDILMRAEVTSRTVVDRKTGKPRAVQDGVLTRMAYAPSMGSAEERAARLEDLMAGRTPVPLPRRPQPERPEPSKDDVEEWDRLHPPAQPVPRIGQNIKVGPKKDD